MMGAGPVAKRSTVRHTSRDGGSPSGRLIKLVLRTVLILVTAGLVVAGATMFGNTPLGQRIPGTFFPFTAVGGRGPGGPDDAPGGAVTNATDPRAAAPQAGRGPGANGGAGPVNPSGSNGAPGAVNSAGTNGFPDRPGAGQQQGLFSGRNSPSVQRGWPEELRYLAIFAIMTSIVALALRLIRPRRRRPQGVRASAVG